MVLVGAVLAGAAYLAGPTIVDWMRQVGAGAGAGLPSPSTAPRATPAPTLTTPAPTPTATRAPTATRSPTPSTAPTPTPAATPQIHVVVRGENLGVIAARYGVTAAAVKKANGIKDPSLIYVGQHLVIPPP